MSENYPDPAVFDKHHLWHPYASVGNPPPVHTAVGASGTRIMLSDGTTLIDAVSSWWCMAHGHNHPKIMQAIAAQTEHLSHVMFAGFTHPPALKLCEALLKRLPPPLNKIFLADSGSIAVECAVKMALQYQYACGKPKRRKLIALHGAYHGDTVGAMALSESEGMHSFFSGILPKHFFAPRPQCAFDAPWDERDFQGMADLIEKEHEHVAAVICEPIFQAANAMYFYHPNYLRKLRACCDHYGLLLIFDEIATGFGRTGRYFAQEHAGVTPDIMCLGKILTGGAMTLACTVATADVARAISAVTPRGVTAGETDGAFMHGPTFMANALACTAACASLELLDAYDWHARVQRIETVLKNELPARCRSKNVRAIRVLGACGVLEVDHIPSYEKCQKAALESGVYLRPFGNYIYTMPPYITPDDELIQICAAMAHLAEL